MQFPLQSGSSSTAPVCLSTSHSPIQQPPPHLFGQLSSPEKPQLHLQGHWSPIVRQMRGSTKPDGMCLVVGSCASGFAPEHNR